jgi:sulfide dehydrogenase [flavocytochrome c] flavoprotein chain
MNGPRLDRRRALELGALAAAGAMLGVDVRAAGGAKARVVIVGGGFAGSACALQLQALRAGIDITLVDPVRRYATCPMSNEVIAGLRDLSSITLSRQGLQGAGISVISDRVLAIDSQRRRLALGAGHELAFDRLVVAPGIRFLYDRIEGYDERAAQRMPHAWKAGEQTAILTRQLRAMPDGGVVAISVPAGLLRCPPGPYERASLIAHYLKQHKPRSKVLILDANNSFPKQALFSDAWRTLYGNLIEWVPMTQDGAVVRVDSASMTLHTASASHRVAVANIIPPQAPGELAPASALASDHGWCPINRLTFESALVPGIHVIGDACIADAMPKSASAAFSQARQCAVAIAALLAERPPPAAMLDSVCYSRLSTDLAIAFRGQFELTDGRIVAREAATAASSSLDRQIATEESVAAARWYTEIRAASFAA